MLFSNRLWSDATRSGHHRLLQPHLGHRDQGKCEARRGLDGHLNWYALSPTPRHVQIPPSNNQQHGLDNSFTLYTRS